VKVLIVADGLKGAVEGDGGGQRRGLFESDAGEDGFLNSVDVMRAETDADVERLLKMKLRAGAYLMERSVGGGGEIQGEGVAALFEAEAPGSGAVQLDALSDSTGNAPILERGFA
jgi:hypothetical protein